MRSLIALTAALAVALAAGQVSAAEPTAPQQKVSVDSPEGKAILIKVRALTRQLVRMNRPIVLPNPVPPMGDGDRAMRSGDPFELPPLYYTPPATPGTSSRNTAKSDRIIPGRAQGDKVRAERDALISRLDVSPAELNYLLAR